MLEQFLDFSQKKKLFSATDKILLSVSGGRDSIVLMKLFSQAGISFSVAHCNYHLRGNDSDRDMDFVKNACLKYGNPKIHIVEFDTEKYAKENKLSIEMAARQLRYDWYCQLCNEEGYTRIATAHHLNDQSETFFINILRSTGINGIRGIPTKRPIKNMTINGKQCYIIRPLMFLSRKDIDKIVTPEEYVDDYTNFTDKYVRNYIRHNIITKLEEIQPDFPRLLDKSLEQFDCAAQLLEKLLSEKYPKVVDKNGITAITIPENFSESELQSYLYFMLNGFGFNLAQIKNISRSTKSVGSLFYSCDFELLIDRKKIFVRKKVEINDVIYTIDENTREIEVPLKLKFTKLSVNEIETLKTPTNIALLDYEKLHFPLEISLGKDGENFIPLGMNCKKKLSDFYIDKKVDYFTKNSIFAIRSQHIIAWLIGLRIDDRFKIDVKTKFVYKIELY